MASPSETIRRLQDALDATPAEAKSADGVSMRQIRQQALDSAKAAAAEGSAPAGPIDQARRFLSGEGGAASAAGQVAEGAREKAGLFSLPPGSPINESRQGISLLERAYIQNLITNPETMASWLRAKGYEAYTYKAGDSGTATGLLGLLPDAISKHLRTKTRIAVRNPGEDTFSVVDPAGLDAQDFLKFWGDLIFNAPTQTLATEGMAAGGAAGAAIGAPSGPGAVIPAAAGALVGGAVTGAPAGAGMELSKEGIASGVARMTGQPDPFPGGPSGPDIANAALGGAVMGPLAELLGVTGKGVANATRAATNSMKEISGQILSKTAAVPARALAWALANRHILQTPDLPDLPYALSQKLSAFLTNRDENRTVSYQLAKSLLDNQGTGQVRLKPMFESLNELMTPPYTDLPTIRNPATGRIIQQATRVPTIGFDAGVNKIGLEGAGFDTTRNHITKEMGALAHNAGADSVEDAIAKDATIPTQIADQFKRTYAEGANRYAAGLVDPAEAPRGEANKILSAHLKEGIRQTLPADIVRGQYDKAMARTKAQLDIGEKMAKEILDPDPVISPDGTIHAGAKGERFISRLMTDKETETDKALIRNFSIQWDHELGMAGLGDFYTRARNASMLSQLRAQEYGIFTGQPAKVAILPGRMSFGGLPMGVTLGAAAGGVAGMPFGPHVAARFAGFGAATGGYSGTPIGAVRSASAVSTVADGLDALFGGPARGIANAPEATPAASMFGQTARTAFASGGSAPLTQDLGRQEKAGAIKNVDQKTLADLSKIRDEVVSGMMTNPAVTAEMAADQFRSRAADYMKEKGIVPAGGAPLP